MKRNLYRIGLAATLALCLVPAAASAEPLRYQVQGRSANVETKESTGCISTWAFVSFYDNRVQQSPGPGQQSGGLDVYVSVYDDCQNVYLFNGGRSGPLPMGAAFDIAPALKSASLTTSVDVYDWSYGTPMSVLIDLDWTGMGDAVHGTSRFQMYNPHYKYMSHTVGSFCEAEVAGTILVGNTNLAVGGPGFLHSSQNGYLIISN